MFIFNQLSGINWNFNPNNKYFLEQDPESESIFKNN